MKLAKILPNLCASNSGSTCTRNNYVSSTSSNNTDNTKNKVVVTITMMLLT